MTSRELTSGFDYWSRGHLRMAVVHLPIKFGALVFSGYKDLIFFCRLGLKVLLMPPKFQLFGLLPPKLRDTLFRPTKGTPLRGTTRFEPSLFQIRHTVRHNTCLRNKKGKKDSVKLAIRPDHPCCRIEVKVCMPGGLQCVVTVFCHLCVLKCLFIIINVKNCGLYTS